MLKSLRFLPLCVLVFSGYAFAHEQDNSSSDGDVFKRAAVLAAAAKSSVSDVKKSGFHVAETSYIEVIRNEIKNQLGDSLEIYKGMTCSMRVGLLRDGTIIYAVDYSGDSNFCNTAISAVRSVKKFPPPPSEQIYQDVKDFTLHFKL
ncbi:cell envelope integrity protein TolA [Salmonella enterica]|nr:cell envelope integrity protein TolA [Salmonella enterica]